MAENGSVLLATGEHLGFASYGEEQGSQAGPQPGPPADMGNTSAGAVLALAQVWHLLILGNKNYKLIISVSRCELDSWSNFL